MAIANAILNGYRLLDSAFNYESEGALGEAIQQAGAPRTELRVFPLASMQVEGRNAKRRSYALVVVDAAAVAEAVRELLGSNTETSFVPERHNALAGMWTLGSDHEEVLVSHLEVLGEGCDLDLGL